MFRKGLVSALWIVFFALLASSCGQGVVKPADKGRLFFWKAVGVSNTVYLMGSVHAADESIYPLDPVIENAFSNSDYLVLELDPYKSQTAINVLIMKEGMYFGKDSLSNNIPPALYQSLGAYTQDKKLSMQVLDRMKPWLVGFTLSGINMQNSGAQAASGIETYFLNRIGETKPVLELETAEFQIKLFSRMNLTNQIHFLASQMQPPETMKNQFAVLLNLWKTGNIEDFEKFVLYPKDNWEKEFNKSLIDDRNITMTEKIMQFLRGGGTYFVIVGAAHYVGEKGIISLLEQKGIKILRY
ncbi:MAG: TraB/GumN family protein [Brevinematales bacterium]|nr:TraB/GumN family protein [Brevinematales bacterium]